MSIAAQVVRECWCESLSLEQASSSDVYFDSGGDSLLATVMLAAIARRLDIEVGYADLLSDPTLGGLTSFVCGGGAAGDQTRFLRLRSEGDDPPLFIVTSHEPEWVGVRRLVPELSATMPVSAISVRDLWPEKGLARVETIAAELERQIQEEQPQGPVFLCGVSFGGLIAFEAAKLLSARGRNLQGVILVDSACPRGLGLRARTGWAWRTIRLHLDAASSWRPTSRVKDVTERDLLRADRQRGRAVRDAARLALLYRPKPWNRTSEVTLIVFPGSRRALRSQALGWEAVVPAPTLLPINGSHADMFGSITLPPLARALNSIVQGSERG